MLVFNSDLSLKMSPFGSRDIVVTWHWQLD